MTSLFVLIYPDERLRIKAEPVLHFDDTLKQHVKDMFETMYQEHGVGLAATQVNIHQRIVVMDTSEKQDQPHCFINPEIVYQEGKYLCDEACISFPGIYAKVERAKIVRVKYMDDQGNPKEVQLEGLAGQCIQHEIDHLNGIVFIDHLSNLKRMRLLKKMQKQQKLAL